jgi:hypothetical protein
MLIFRSQAAAAAGKVAPMKALILITSCVFAFTTFAQDPAQVPSVLSFQAWKEQQILDAQNQTLRISARISQLKSAKSGATQDPKQTVLAEKELRRSQESLQIASQLTLEDYAIIYLPTLHAQPEALQAVAAKLSKEEMAEILKTLVKNYPSTRDAKRSSGVAAEALTLSTKAKPL